MSITETASSSDDSELPLAGIKVVDFTTALSGPFATQSFGDLGADVIKVEKPGGDDSRHWGPPFVGDTASYFVSINRNKRSIVLDLKADDDLETAKKLTGVADVVIENFRPGVAARLGIGPDAVREMNPSVIYCSLSGYGATQPSRPGYDQVVQATSGWMSLTGESDGQPLRAGVPVGDVATGMSAVQGVLAALFRRERTGQGAFVDIAMQDTLVSMLAYQAGRYFATEEPQPRTGNMHPTVAPYGVFSTADGNVVIAVGNDGQFRRLCTALSLEGARDDPRFADNQQRKAHQPELVELISNVLTQMPRAKVLALLDEAGVPAATVNDLRDVFTDPATAERGLVLGVEAPDGTPFRAPGGAWHIDGRFAQVHRNAPSLNADGDDIRTEIH